MKTRLAGAVLALASSCALAEGPNNYMNPGFDPNRDYLNHGYGEHIDPFTGSLQLTAIDVSIPGNGGFAVNVVRSYSLIRSTIASNNLSPYGKGWDIHFGRVQHNAGQLCNAQVDQQSLILELPDGNTQKLFRAKPNANSTVYVPGLASGDYVTSRLWKATCAANQQGIIVHAPNGTRYEMTELDDTGSYWLAKRIVDRNDQAIDITYEQIGSSPANSWYRKAVKSVSAMGNSQLVVFNYSGGVLYSIQSQGRTWQFTIPQRTIAGAQQNQLDRVITPENQTWTYYYFGDRGTQAGTGALQGAVNPWGGRTDYDYRFETFFTTPNNYTQKSPTVYTKKAGIDTWTFDYSPSGSSGVYDTTTVTLPGSVGGGTITYKHFGYRTVAVDGVLYGPEGISNNMWKVGLLAQKLQGSVQTETLSWIPQDISDELPVTDGFHSVDQKLRMPILQQRSIQRDGGTYYTTYSNHDTWGNPRAIAEQFGGNTRSSSLTYTQYTTGKWLLGLPDANTTSGIGTISYNYESGNTGNVASINRYGAQTSYTYFQSGDQKGAVNTKRDANNNQTIYSDWYRGVARSEQRPEQVSITRSVDNFGNVTRDSDGESDWLFTYDDLNRPSSINYPVGSDATINWANQRKTFTRGAFNEVTDFDPFGRITKVTRNGIATNLDIDVLGRKEFESFPGSTNGIDYDYDILGRLKMQAHPAGLRSFVYRSDGAVQTTTERGFTEVRSFDRYGNPDEGFPTGISLQSIGALTMERNAIGNLKKVSQGGINRTYTYNAKQLLDSITEPETGTTTLNPDDMGNPRTKTVGGVSTTYGYDGLNRLKTATYGGTLGSVTYAYNKRGQVKTVTSLGGSNAIRSYQYDSNGNLTEDKIVVDGRTFIVSYTYGALDGLATITYPSATGVTPLTINLVPDNFGRPTLATPFLSDIEYYPSGNMSRMSFANGRVAILGEEFARKIPNSISVAALPGVPDASAMGLSYTYDPAGNVATITGDMNRTLGYDTADRMTSVAGPWGSGSVTYHDNGNITSHQYGPSYQIGLVYDASNKLSNVTGTNPISTIEHDTRGNMTRRGGATFQFDNASSLDCVDCGLPNQIKYGYDGRGWRVWEEKNGVKTYFFHAANGDLLFEYTPVHGFWKQHAYLGGKRIATRANDKLPVAITWETVLDPPGDPNGKVVLLKARVSPATGASVPTGTVTFTQDQGFSASAPLVNGVASLAPDAFDCGNYATSVSYSGDESHLVNDPVTTPVKSYVYAKCAPIVHLDTNPLSPQNEGVAIQLTGRVSGTHGTPSGTVTFRNGATVLGSSIQLDANGQATVSAFNLPVGTNSLSVTYSGNTTYNTGSASVTYVINGQPNDPPSVYITAPDVDTTIAGGASITISANATDSDGTIASVTFFDGGTQIGGTVSVSGSSYSIPWSTTVAGTHALTAVARDNRNRESVSGARTVTVVCPPPNLPPTISILSPQGGVRLTGPLTVDIAVNASDEDGQVTKVEFFNNAVKIGESTSVPFSFAWNGVGGGDYTLTAVATDQCTATTTSAPVAFSVDQAVGIVNGGFEDPPAPANSYLAPGVPTGWTTSASNLLSTGYSTSIGYPPAPEGQQVVAVGSADYNNFIRQPLYLVPGSYVIRGFAMRGTTTTSPLKVMLAGIERGQLVLQSHVWQPFTTSPIEIAETGSYDLELSNAGGGLFADKVQLFAQDATVVSAFSSGYLDTNTVAQLTLTFTNARSSAISGVAFSSTYPAGLVNASPSNATTTCGGTVTGAAGGGGLALSGATLAPQSSCTVTVSATSTTGGTFIFDTGDVSTTNAGYIASSTAALTVTSTVPVFRAASTLNGSGTLSFPSGTLPTDGLVMSVVSQGAIATPTGWSLVASHPWSGQPYTSQVFTRQAGSGSSVVVTTTNGGATIVGYRSTSGVGVVGAFAQSAAGDSTIPLSAITPQDVNSLVLGLVTDRDVTNPTPPADFASRGSFLMTSFGNNVADKSYRSTASTESPAWQQASSGAAGGPYPAVGVLLELKPASVGASAGFSPASIAPNGTSALTITLTNTRSVTVSGISFASTFPSGIVVAPTPNAATTCGAGTVTAAPGGNSISLASGSVPASTTCTVTVNVTSPTLGIYVSSTGSIGTTNAGVVPAASATLSVVTQPSVSIAFSPGTVALNGTSALTITLTNGNVIAAAGSAITNTYPSGLRNAPAPGAATTCPGGSVSAAAGGASVSLSGASIPASGSCTVTVNVTSGVAATYANIVPAGALTTANVGSSAASASASLVVSAPTMAFANGSFEAPVFTPGTYGPFPAGYGWNLVGETGISTSALSTSVGYPPAPDGVQYANLTTGARIGQSVYLVPGTYTILFRAMTHASYPGVTVKVLFAGSQIANVAPPAAAWGSYTSSPFPVNTAGTYVFEFAAGDTSASGYFYLDDIRFPNVVPAVTLSSPQPNQSLNVNQPFTLSATATDADGTIQNVKFLDGTTELATITSPPYSYTWTPTAIGSHTITARATDNAGGTGAATATVNVVCASNATPVVNLTTPTNNQTYTGPATVVFNASPTDSDGSIVRVEYFNGAAKLGETTTAPHSFSWSNVQGQAQAYSVSAKATDNCGGSATEARSITVSLPPLPAFVNGSFETPVFAPNTYGPWPAGTSWTNFGETGYSTSGISVSVGYPPAPDGNQYANFGVTGGIRQSVYLTPGNYTIRFRAMTNTSYPGVTVKAVRNGVTMTTVAPPGAAWGTYTASFTVDAAGNQVFEFAAGVNSAYGYFYLDDIRFN